MSQAGFGTLQFFCQFLNKGIFFLDFLIIILMAFKEQKKRAESMVM